MRCSRPGRGSIGWALCGVVASADSTFVAARRALDHALKCQRAQPTSTTSFERSETEHPPFAARLVSEWPPRKRRRSKRRPL
ncbi:hypothetical protein ACWEPH_24820, partial [Nocardia beijingensis]